jgi:hypothetical protein
MKVVGKREVRLNTDNNVIEIPIYQKPVKRRNWTRLGPNTYEVSSNGDSSFSALFATFKAGTIVNGIDVGGRTIEDAY